MNWLFIRQVGYLNFFYRKTLRQLSKRILQVDNTIKLPNGIYMNLPRISRFGTEVFITNCDVDWGSESLLIQNLDKTKTFLDIGANIGYYSLLVSPSVKNVFAFEPDPRNLKELEANCNKLSNIQVRKQAVYSRNGELRFDITGDTATSHIINQGGKKSEEITVQAITLDEFSKTESNLQVTAIKIDVEGFDFEVLKGAQNLIIRDQPLILTELDIKAETNFFEYLEQLNYLGFALALKNKHQNNRFTFAKLPKPKLVKITNQNIFDIWYKMLFLVPNRLCQQFDNLVEYLD